MITTIQDEQRSRRLREVNQESVIEAIESNSSFTTRMLTNKHSCFRYAIEQIQVFVYDPKNEYRIICQIFKK